MRPALVLMLLFCPIAQAQDTGSIIGVVRDAKTHQPLEGVGVFIQPCPLRLPDPLFPTLKLVTDARIGFQTVTDAGGNYSYPGLPPHQYCLEPDRKSVV